MNMADRDITALVDFGGNDDEHLPLSDPHVVDKVVKALRSSD